MVVILHTITQSDKKPIIVNPKSQGITSYWHEGLKHYTVPIRKEMVANIYSQCFLFVDPRFYVSGQPRGRTCIFA